MYSVALATFLVFLGCCSNLFFLELLTKEDPGSGNLITFTQFLFISINGFVFTTKFGTVKAKIPMSQYILLVTMFFLSSVLNNYAFNFNIPMPLHMIFRSGSLIANMIMGIVILSKRYTLDKYLSVIMITLGVIICTIVSGKQVKSTAPTDNSDGDGLTLDHFFWWVIGIIILTVALFISARMGILQETMFKKYGKETANEALYYSHVLPLPFFLLLASNLWEHTIVAVNSPAISIPIIGLNVPRMALYLIGNMVTQYLCISSVFNLTTQCTSLTVTLILTLRKFLSLLFSIVYFKNPFTIHHWLGTTLVFTGTLVFTEVAPKIKKALLERRKDKQF